MIDCIIALGLAYLLIRFTFFLRKCFYFTLAAILLVVARMFQALAWVIDLAVKLSNGQSPKCRN